MVSGDIKKEWFESKPGSKSPDLTVASAGWVGYYSSVQSLLAGIIHVRNYITLVCAHPPLPNLTMHMGELTVETAPGPGTCITVDLPISPAHI